MWAKAVTGVDLMQHCAKSLTGEYVQGLGPGMEEMSAPLGSGADILAWYFCAVAKPFRWANNTHLLAVPELGSVAHVEGPGIEATITDARLVPLSEEWIDEAHPKARFKTYRTCRNWQGAWWIDSHLIGENA